MAVVDILLVCYNQEQFIEKTLYSVISQKTNFEYRVIVADDCSKDNTINIIKKIDDETNIEFVYLDRSTNLGISNNYYRSFNQCGSKYVAVMEGDDLWIDEYRLQKHIDFLEAHPDYSMTFNKIVTVTDDNNIHIQPDFKDEDYDRGYQTVDGNMLALSNVIGNFSACVYRTDYLKKIDKEIFMEGYDWIVNLKMSQLGKICCFLQPQSVYRIHVNGVWSGMSRIEQLKDTINAIKKYDQLTDYEFTESFKIHSNRLKAELYSRERYDKKSESGNPGDENSKPRSAITLIMNEIRAIVSRLITLVQR